MTKLVVDWATHEATRHACTNWHYSRSVPAGKLVKIGAWEDERFIGVVVFSRGANQSLGRPYGLEQDRVCELTRVALRDHRTPVSKVLSLAIKFLRKASPGTRLIVSYADKDQGHHGGIYQATNWCYVGLMNPGTKCNFLVHGKSMHPRSIGAKGLRQTLESVRRNLDPNAIQLTTAGKHKYLYPLDADMARLIEPMRKPYPKRPKYA